MDKNRCSSLRVGEQSFHFVFQQRDEDLKAATFSKWHDHSSSEYTIQFIFEYADCFGLAAITKTAAKVGTEKRNIQRRRHINCSAFQTSKYVRQLRIIANGIRDSKGLVEVAARVSVQDLTAMTLSNGLRGMRSSFSIPERVCQSILRLSAGKMK